LNIKKEVKLKPTKEIKRVVVSFLRKQMVRMQSYPDMMLIRQPRTQALSSDIWQKLAMTTPQETFIKQLARDTL
jgi:hypothetical protein